MPPISATPEGIDQDFSIPQEEATLAAWAAANDCVITHWFRDAARPGSATIGREGLTEYHRFIVAEYNCYIFEQCKRKSDQLAPKSVKPLIASIQALINLLIAFNDQGIK